ncbi:ATP-grasp domain-containing protein [Nocardia sp. NPDC004340]
MFATAFLQYSGKGPMRPKEMLLEQGLKHRSGTAPSAYGIDFGVLSTGENALVEANDGYALGAYAITADRYTELIMRRWSELLASARPGDASASDGF